MYSLFVKYVTQEIGWEDYSYYIFCVKGLIS